VVCVGRGIQNPDNIDIAKNIATNLGGDIACTRPISEGSGWMSRSRYLGVSGASIKPAVYIGLGVSGQVQHTVGMNDKNSPLMKQCDLGIVADVNVILPALEKATS
ncbi:MAG: FAD-binding protein, partial [Eggerthellaceae bacterium]|nr:FAD-binding protein [Eggerthellaceae bacterium]